MTVNNQNLAPLVLFVYNRPWHTQQTVEALQKSVDEVREYVDTINSFKKVTVIKRDKNWGLANSIIDGIARINNECKLHGIVEPKFEEIEKFDLSHDRFLIIDENEVYHFGASLKDLGKKWFAVSKMDINSIDIIKKLEKQ